MPRVCSLKHAPNKYHGRSPTKVGKPISTKTRCDWFTSWPQNAN